ncbi:hypothetical protein PR048_031676 [Dryococelus australis]|uniref:Uncharacterized protein n=1 Tax=Dryococelus australis TaxID=614101 RepID=A0ABQ9G9Z9_9NEOP|nr:hypothetical protein PR048_031676 [Dryococelus australis]
MRADGNFGQRQLQQIEKVCYASCGVTFLGELPVSACSRPDHIAFVSASVGLLPYTLGVDSKLPLFFLAYRSAVHDSTRVTPSRMLFGRELRLPGDLLFGCPVEEEAATPVYANKLRQKAAGVVVQPSKEEGILPKAMEILGRPVQDLEVDKSCGLQDLQTGLSGQGNCSPAHIPPTQSGFNLRPGHSGFSHVGIVLDDAVARRVFSGIFRFPSPSGAAPYSPQSPSLDISRPRYYESSKSLHFTSEISLVQPARLVYLIFCLWVTLRLDWINNYRVWAPVQNMRIIGSGISQLDAEVGNNSGRRIAPLGPSNMMPCSGMEKGYMRFSGW